MKRIPLCLAMISLLAGCSGQTETATESKTSQINVKNDDLGKWITDIQNDASILTQLNEIQDESGMEAQFASWCDDKDVQTAMKSRHYASVIDNPDDALFILRDIPNQGTSWTSPNLDKIESLHAQISSADKPKTFSWMPEDASKLDKSLRTVGFSPNSENASQAFIQLLKGQDCEKVLPRYCEFARTAAAEQAQTATLKAERDARMVCDLTQWAGELRLNYPQNDYMFDRFRKYVSDKTIVSSRKQAFINDMGKRGVNKAFDHIQPPDPQYAALKKSRKIYLDAIEADGWPDVKSPAKVDDPKMNKSYNYVPSLKTRLNAEGYDAGDPQSDVFDQKLADAVSLYRDVHQLNNKKLVDTVLFRNLTVSPQDRLAVIDLAMQKYRESAIGSLDYYVKVNIPDFYVEVWRNGTREARHRIVVGNDKLQHDPVTKKVMPDPETLYPWHPNRTPIQTSKINEIILNPYWNVPPRIRMEELEPKLAENPNYYAENNYEEVNKDDPKTYYVRELPNPKNSLGKVKFMFPNPHNTYLHDTPAKGVFKSPTRAFSHGCMRVQDPLKLAELLLKNDGQWDESKFNSILRADPLEQVPIELKHPVDVDVVYINARVDDSGVVAFLSDVYQYDAVRTGKVVLKKLPKPKDWK